MATTTEPRGRLLISVDEVAARLDVSRSYAYRLVETGELDAVRIGRSVRVYADSVGALLGRSRIGPPRPVEGPRPADTCRWGHVGSMVPNSQGRIVCRECVRASNRDYMRRRRAVERSGRETPSPPP